MMEYSDIVSGDAAEVTIEESLHSIYFKLLRIVTELDELRVKPFISSQDVGKLQNKLHQIDRHYSSACIKKGGQIPAGQAVISELLSESYEAAHELLCKIPEDEAAEPELEGQAQIDAMTDEMIEQVDPVVLELHNLILALEELQNKPHLRRAEIAKVQHKLKDIEVNAVDNQQTMDKLRPHFDAAYALVFDLLTKPHKKDLSMAIDESLWPVETELKKVIHSLHELRKKPIKSIREKDLRYAQDKLQQIDSMYNEGVFKTYGTDPMPRGQAVLSSMLNKAHQMMYDMVVRLPDEQAEPAAI
jgi:hypothetical protein